MYRTLSIGSRVPPAVTRTRRPVQTPSARDKSDAWLGVIRAHFPTRERTIARDRLEASLASLEAGKSAARGTLGNDPPKLLFSTRPSLLVLTDGKPVLRRTGQGALLRAINTRALLLQEAGLACVVVETEGRVGGGSLPLRKLPGSGVSVEGEPAALLSALRSGDPPVVAVVREGRVVLDVRCVGDVAALATALRRILSTPARWPALRARCRAYVAGQTLEAWAQEIRTHCEQQWGVTLPSGRAAR